MKLAEFFFSYLWWFYCNFILSFFKAFHESFFGSCCRVCVKAVKFCALWRIWVSRLISPPIHTKHPVKSLDENRFSLGSFTGGWWRMRWEERVGDGKCKRKTNKYTHRPTYKLTSDFSLSGWFVEFHSGEENFFSLPAQTEQQNRIIIFPWHKIKYLPHNLHHCYLPLRSEWEEKKYMRILMASGLEIWGDHKILGWGSEWEWEKT